MRSLKNKNEKTGFPHQLERTGLSLRTWYQRSPAEPLSVFQTMLYAFMYFSIFSLMIPLGINHLNMKFSFSQNDTDKTSQELPKNDTIHLDLSPLKGYHEQVRCNAKFRDHFGFSRQLRRASCQGDFYCKSSIRQTPFVKGITRPARRGLYIWILTCQDFVGQVDLY